MSENAQKRAFQATAGIVSLISGIFIAAGSGADWLQPVARLLQWLAVHPGLIAGYLLILTGVVLLGSLYRRVRE
jgi:hypothetical protein